MSDLPERHCSRSPSYFRIGYQTSVHIEGGLTRPKHGLQSKTLNILLAIKETEAHIEFLIFNFKGCLWALRTYLTLVNGTIASTRSIS
jgi:hypothetical protein